MSAIKSESGAVIALIRAAEQAARARALDAGSHEDPVIPTLLRGAPSHSAAYLLHALEDAGWKLVQERP